MTARLGIATVGGMDPTGGAGLLRDAWTISRRAPELELLAVCTAVTRQGHGQPATYASANPDTLARELGRVANYPRLRAVKLGMIPGDRVDQIAEFLAGLQARSPRPLVVCDPVIMATDGGRLGPSGRALLELAARVDLLTPNVDEARELMKHGPLPSTTAVLFKGEAVEDRPDRIRDRLYRASAGELVLERPRVSGPDPRGTGCALASAIASELARGRSLVTAVVAGVAWLDGARMFLQLPGEP
ncbi:Hydroxymethylpyrimidine phosphate kinase ThiD [Enhygromyxa salina]|uniref:Hydroxymethylpyrimidine phosphate kinase ThiD n=1 Tax=Enhygromyxa salina TaxID=215803 RepID=A0A0C1ZCW3_9BACT|nr:bifunctional hydroxymethylpyrimidine kinase/phosphomethylpyrimidine kinase [Enhygromyxa salina]KIG15544.1 Hydroxymethylpyrimidine phosphate kinase ThiD [Enhygromyxa salina]